MFYFYFLFVKWFASSPKRIFY